MAAEPSASHDHQAAVEDGNPTEILTYMDAELYTAAAEGQVNTLKAHRFQDDLLLQRTPQRNTLLHVASQFGKLSCVYYIISLGDNSSLLCLLQQPNLKGDTALHLAAREGHCEVVNALINAAKSRHPDSESDVGAHKAMMRMSNKTGGTALHEAVRYNHQQVVKLLVKEDPEFIYGADSGPYTPLYMAAERGHRDLVKIIIENTRSSPAHSGILGRTALHAAVIRRDLEMTKRILAWQPILAKEVDHEGWSPLHCAAYLKDAAIAEELLNKSPDKSVIYLGIKNGRRTALHIASFVGSIEIVKLLLLQAPDCSEQVDAGGYNVFHFAMTEKNFHHQMGGKLLKIDGLRVRWLANQKDGDGDTPLHRLASLGVNDKQFVMDEIVDKKARDNKLLYAIERIVSEHCFPMKTLHVLHDGVGVAFRPHKSLQLMDATTPGDKKTLEVKEFVSYIQKAAKSHSVVAALVATVTFAAGFTLPGGYGGEDGLAVLSKKASFKAFVASDAIAFSLSVGAMFFYILIAVFSRRPRLLAFYVLCGYIFTLSGIAAMLVAFVTGLYAGLPFSFGLPILTSYLVISLFIYLGADIISTNTDPHYCGPVKALTWVCKRLKLLYWLIWQKLL